MSKFTLKYVSDDNYSILEASTDQVVLDNVSYYLARDLQNKAENNDIDLYNPLYLWGEEIYNYIEQTSKTISESLTDKSYKNKDIYDNSRELDRKEVIRLHDECGYTYEEIGKIFGRSRTWANNLYHGKYQGKYGGTVKNRRT